ncbi:MAG: phosphatase PAP2 family protein [Rhizobiaceae bacterium]|nr:phosphatase PAP2 family protein [Rhizobiaceae bacterium]
MNSARFTYQIMTISIGLSLLAALVFLSFPWIDLVIQRTMFQPSSGFFLNNYESARIARTIAMTGYMVWYVAIVLFAFDALKNPQRQLWIDTGLGLRQWLYLFFTSLIGPLVIANLLLKNNWGRARPREIIEFGGKLEFSPPLLISDQCQNNCSFVSGEPSSMVMIFISLAFIVAAKRKLFVVLAIVMGAMSGFMRMGQGGHFFSDVIFATLFMMLTAAVIYWVMFLTPWARRNQ